MSIVTVGIGPTYGVSVRLCVSLFMDNDLSCLHMGVWLFAKL